MQNQKPRVARCRMARSTQLYLCAVAVAFLCLLIANDRVQISRLSQGKERVERLLAKERSMNARLLSTIPKGNGSLSTMEARMPDRVRESGPTKDFSGSHTILAMSDEQFNNTPVSRLVEEFYGPETKGTSDGRESCDGDFGIELMKRWRLAKTEICAPLGEIAASPIRVPHKVSFSTVNCYPLKQTGHSGIANLCDMRDVVVDMSPFSDQELIKKTMDDYKASKHEDDAYLHFKQPLVTGHCRVQTDKFDENSFTGWNRDWVWKGFRGLEFRGVAEAEERELGCERWEETPSIIVQRHTFANMYHDSEDFWNVFMAMGILQLARSNVLVTDLYPWGPFKAMWGEALAGGGALSAWEVRGKYGGARVCFRRLVVGTFGPASALTIMKRKTRCHSSPLVRAYADFVLRGFRLQTSAHATLKEPPASVLVSYMARRSSVLWPERAYCDDRFFVCSEWTHLGSRKLHRVVKNDAEVVAGLSGMEREEFGARRVVFADFDFNVLPFREQLRVDSMTDVMVGAHGAGLTHALFMPDRAVLVELFIDGSHQNQHFHNMARWRGRTGSQYLPVLAKNPVDVAEIKRVVRQAVHSVDISKY